MSIFKKKCPKCGRDQVYGSQKVFRRALKGEWECRKCATKESAKHLDKSHFSSEEYRNKMSSVLKEKRKSNSYGESFKQKCRENKLKQIKSQGVSRTYNPMACEFIDMLNDKFGLKFRHALNGGEVQICGYSLDGYDTEKNIVFEYDEPKHSVKYHKTRDKIREERLVQEIRPSAFWRYDEKRKMLYNTLNKEVICLLQ